MKKKMMKALALALSTAMVLTACTTPAPTAQPEPATATPAPEVSAPADTVAEATPKTGEPITLTVGATSVPHAEILNEVVPILAKENITLVVKEFADYTLLNQALNDKQIDANFFQHTPFLDDYVKNSGQDLISLGNVHIEPMGIYAKSIKNLADLLNGATVGVPNDASNGGRALMLLEANGLIKLKDGVGATGSKLDIVENPLNLDIQEMEASLLPRTLDQLDIAVINTNYALEIGLNPVDNALVMEGKDSPYANIIAIRGEDANRPELLALQKAVTSEEMRVFLLDKYKGAIVPAF